MSTRTVTNRGLRDRRPHKYLADPLTVDEAPVDYTIEDGVLVEPVERPNTRKAYDEFTRYWRQSREEQAAEEQRWAALSGPVTIIQPGRKTA